MFGFLLGKCSSCNALVLDEIDCIDGGRLICKGRGTELTPLAGLGDLMNGKVWRSGQSKTEGLLAKLRVAFPPQHSHGGALARHERVVDRQNNRYLEKVTLCGSGEVIHLCDEPLTDHKEHGSARK